MGGRFSMGDFFAKFSEPKERRNRKALAVSNPDIQFSRRKSTAKLEDVPLPRAMRTSMMPRDQFQLGDRRRFPPRGRARKPTGINVESQAEPFRVEETMSQKSVAASSASPWKILKPSTGDGTLPAWPATYSKYHSDQSVLTTKQTQTGGKVHHDITLPDTITRPRGQQTTSKSTQCPCQPWIRVENQSIQIQNRIREKQNQCNGPCVSKNSTMKRIQPNDPSKPKCQCSPKLGRAYKGGYSTFTNQDVNFSKVENKQIVPVSVPLTQPSTDSSKMKNDCECQVSDPRYDPIDPSKCCLTVNAYFS